MKRILFALLVLVFALSFCSKKSEVTELQQKPLLVKAELPQKGTLAKILQL